MTVWHPIIAVAGMAFEASIAEGAGVRVVYGQDRKILRERIEGYARDGASAIVSFGTAGGLAPHLVSGDVFIATNVLTAKAEYRTSPDWCRAMELTLPAAQFGTLWGADGPVMTVAAKRELWTSTGASVVDMESGLAAAVAKRSGVPFIALRVVIDPAHRTVPTLALTGINLDGSENPLAVAKGLIKHPLQLPALLRLAEDARKAKRALLRSRQALGHRFGFPDAG